MSKVQRFKARVGTTGPGTSFIELPFDVKAVFGKTRAPVKVTVGAHTYRSTVCVYDGISYVPLRKSNREAAGVDIGDAVAVVIALDEGAREVEIPAALARAFAAKPRARAAWDALSFSHRREHAEAILGAKKPETQARRVEKAIEMLLASGKSR